MRYYFVNSLSLVVYFEVLPMLKLRLEDGFVPPIRLIVRRN